MYKSLLATLNISKKGIKESNKNIAIHEDHKIN